MTCDDVTPALLAWQLGACESPERDAIDVHLATCPACLGRFLATKRITEDAAAFDERPAPAVRERLRGHVARRARRPVRTSWVVGLAAAALLLGFLGWRVLTPAPLTTPPAAAGHGLVDADGPANLDVL
ncbi:MAG: zf-HC2 domain-containing protein [Archangium sp.]|nr:zf-HC2 domain-containing protein [Archangium sp.]